MTEHQPETLSAAEWKVMKIVWELQSCAARDVYQITLAKFDWQPGTTKTVLRRLVDKGHLSTKQIGNSFLYQPVSNMKDTICDAADELLEDAPEEMSASLLFHMVQKGKLRGKDVCELREMLDQYDESGGDES